MLDFSPVEAVHDFSRSMRARLIDTYKRNDVDADNKSANIPNDKHTIILTINVVLSIINFLILLILLFTKR